MDNIYVLQVLCIMMITAEYVID